MKKQLLLVGSLVLFEGCATSRGSTLFGLTLGVAAGGVLGNAIGGNSPEGTLLGAALGAGAGALLGHFGNSGNQKKEVLKPRVLPGVEKLVGPKLTQPKYRSLWIPDKIEGDKFIEGHRVYFIEEQTKWVSE